MEAILIATSKDNKMLFHNSYDLERYCKEHDGQELVVSIKPMAKTSPKMLLYAFYHGPLLDCFIKAYTSAGYDGIDKVKADFLLRAEFAKDFILKKNGEAIPYIIDKKDMTKERLTKFVQDCLFHLEDEFKMTPPDAEEYKLNKGSSTKFKAVK